VLVVRRIVKSEGPTDGVHEQNWACNVLSL
jgi:hypothetical protein